jgi:hypothetical protein
MAQYQITVNFQSPLDFEKKAFGPCRRTTVEWSHLKQEYRARDVICVPYERLALDTRVDDEIAGICSTKKFSRGRLTIDNSNHPRQRCVVVVLESPHFHEYRQDDRHTLTPVAPLNNPTSRGKFEGQIRRIIAKVISGAKGTVDVVLCNPVPLQASLAHMMETEYQESVQGLVRNFVWSALFHDQYDVDFCSRLDSYGPRAVINACTSSPKKKVQGVLNEWVKGLKPGAVRLWDCSAHPSVWDGSTSVTQIK